MPTAGGLEGESGPVTGGLWRRWAPELILAAIAVVVFLGALGTMGLWGKREQRAVAESIDTVDNGHWLVAYIQGRKRLEKPPLPRWSAAALIKLTGRRDIWLLRLPAALSALGIVALVYGLGRRIGGREVGLVSGLALCSTFIFITEMRQAGNDGPLAFFTTLAIYAALATAPRRIGRRSPRAPGRSTRPGRLVLVDVCGARARVPLQGADRLADRGGGRRALPRLHPPIPGRLTAAVPLGRARPDAALGGELADPGGDLGRERGGGLAPGDGPEGRLGRDHPPPPPRDPRRGMARDGRPLDGPGRLGGRAPLDSPRPGRPAGPLARLVVGDGEPRDVLPLERRQAELLRPLPAGRGALGGRLLELAGREVPRARGRARGRSGSSPGIGRSC